jgi:hypothetical protein
MKQHYVPRAYLKNFAIKRGDEYFVNAYDKLKMKFINPNIKNICAEKDFYTLYEDSEMVFDPLALETKLFANGLEPMYEKAYKILTDDSIIEISDIQRVEILIGIFQLYVRNPLLLKISIEHHKAEIIKRCYDAKNKGIKGISYLDEDFSFKESTEENIIAYFTALTIKIFKEGIPLGIDKIGTFHEFSKFEVSKIIDDSQFFTSDNPIAMEDLVTHDDQPFLKSKEFYIPLNAKYSLRIYHDNKERLNTIKRTTTVSGSVAIINSLVYNQSNRFLIGNEKSFGEYFKMIDFLSKPNINLKIDMMRQIVSKIPITADTEEATGIMEEYLKKYDEKGSLTNEEEYELHRKIRMETIKWKKSRI